jgi:SAM-dependent methyltransferase
MQSATTGLFEETLSTDEVLKRLARLVDISLPHAAEVLDAGCGSTMRIAIAQAKHVTVTGIDISEKQLRRNEALHRKVHADLETVDLPSGRYDLVVCWDVLEHLFDPVTTLARLVDATAPGGLLVIAMPNLLSLKGIVAKLTPYTVHVWYYRRVLGWKDAGQDDDGGPFATPFRLSLQPRSLLRRLVELGLEPVMVVYRRTHAMETISAQRGLLGFAIGVASAVLRVVSFCRIRTRDADVVLVARRVRSSRTAS